MLTQSSGLDLHISVSRQGDDFEGFQQLSLPQLAINTYRNIPTALTAVARLPFIQRRFFRYLDENQIQVVYCPSLHIWSPFFLRGIRRRNVRFILTTHDAVAHPGENRLWKNWWIESAIRTAHSHITLSGYVKNKMVAQYGLKSDQIHVIPLGAFDYSEGKALPRKLPVNRPCRLLFYGRILEYKGIGLLLEAFRLLKQRYPDLNLTIAGGGDFSPYQDAADKLDGIDLRIGWVEESDIARLFQQSDILVCPYIEASQSGSVAVALGFGMPVVATSVGGLSEQVIEGQTGFLAEETTPESIAAALDKLMSDPDAYNRCSVNALKDARSRLSWGTVAKRVHKLLISSE